MSGLRLPTFFLSGVLRLNTKRFVLLVAVGAAIWTPIIVFASAFLKTAVPLGATGAVVVSFVLFSLGFRLTDWRRRRFLVGKVKRIWNWEFWPIWLFYAPVVLYVSYLTIRFRGLHFTAANPGMPASGFVGESKDAIYKLIAAAETSDEHLLRFIRVDALSAQEERLRTAIDFIAKNGLSYPIVVKPDVGERGNGVGIVHNEVELRECLRSAGSDVLVQEYVAGIEASIFYYRLPREERGRIFSITEKIFPTLTGDGHSTLEDLILNDSRAHMVADNYFRRHEARLQTVPSLGERVQLVDIGAHSKGAIFHDGGRLRSEELEGSIDRLSRGISGYYFGRYDVRAESFEKLRNGHFKIIELNGVTSESTNIYDAKYSLIDAYKILFSQWRVAFDIGRLNAEGGASRATAFDLVRLIVSRKQTS